MFKWVEPFIWGVLRVLAFVLQLAGLTGILIFILIGLWAMAGYINRM